MDVVTPAGKVLARQLSLAVQPGHSLLVTGPNGSGKTSVFRRGARRGCQVACNAALVAECSSVGAVRSKPA